ncbi:MAG: HDIG domain-containing protein [Spirulina sp. SIO3F2]|nr:HDIG domain-containing protein [Spirulina sp. SIO3F2]
MFGLVVLSLTSVLGYRFYNQPRLKEGTIAPTTVRASRTVTVVDEEQTAEKRKAAETGLVPVLKLDTAITQEIQQDLEALLLQVEQLRETAGAMPFAEEDVLSPATQRYLRSLTAAEWQRFLVELKRAMGFRPLPAPVSGLNPLEITPIVDLETLPTQQAITELEQYARQQSRPQLQALLETIDVSRLGYQQALELLEDNQDLSPAEQAYILELLNLPEEIWLSTREGLRLGLERILTQGLPSGLPADLEANAVQGQLQAQIPETSIALAVEVFTEILEPNLVPDKDGTKQLAEQAAEAVEVVVYEVEKDDIIVESGQAITRREFILLDEFDESLRGIDWQGLATTASVVIAAVGVFTVVQRRLGIRLRCRDRILLTLLSLTPPLLMNFGQYNLVAIGLLGSSFYPPALAVTHVTLLTGLSIFNAMPYSGATIIPWESLIAAAAGGLLTATVAGRLPSREDLAQLGGTVAITQGTVYFVVMLIFSAAPGTIWSLVFPAAALFGLTGLAWCVVALGISPYLERVFDLVTPIRLAELSNLNRPLLKRLATEAPGTYQHTIFVSSLAEAAARELHANVELVRAGTLYHDIGKMHDPMGFIENQMGGPNKHDRINDPWQSAEIIKKHVSEGIAMARRYNLPEAIRHFIPEHQGTISISYFYFQAKERAKALGRTVEEKDFRYDGPIPQSRETGIVMLADACEAALRSLKNVTPETALGTVKKIFRARWQDNQLVDSGLKREEMDLIAEVFVQVWQQHNHQRIAYPKAALEPRRVSSPES